MTAGFKPDAINGAIDLGNTEDLLNLIAYRSRLRDVDRLTTERPGLFEPKILWGTDSPSLDLYVNVRLALTLRPLIIAVNAGLSDEASGVSDDRA